MSFQHILFLNFLFVKACITKTFNISEFFYINKKSFWLCHLVQSFIIIFGRVLLQAYVLQILEVFTKKIFVLLPPCLFNFYFYSVYVAMFVILRNLYKKIILASPSSLVFYFCWARIIKNFNVIDFRNVCIFNKKKLTLPLNFLSVYFQKFQN